MTVEFIAAVCPNCGGELRVPDNQEKVICDYCGAEVIIHDSTKLKAEVIFKVDIEKTLRFAKIAEEAKNYEDGYKYYSKVIESDTNNIDAWFGRARCTAWKPGYNDQKLIEAIAYSKTAQKIGVPTNKVLERTIDSLLAATTNYIDTFYNLLHSEFPIYDDGTSNGRRFEQTYFQILYKTLSYCWSTVPTESTADNIVLILEKLNGIKAYHYISYAKLIDKLNLKYPGEIKKSDSKVCFIATATLGNPNHPYIITLRKYRDDILSSTQIGQEFVRRYYLYSPKYAKMIESSRVLKFLSLLLIVKPAYLLAKVAISNKHRIY